MDIYSELETIINDLQNSISLLNQEEIQKPITSLEKNINEIGKCFSGSWLGYHAYVYYKDLKLPPAGAHFSQEWGIDNVLGISMIGMGTRGEWVEYRPEEIKHYLLDVSKCKNIEDIKKKTNPILNEVESKKRSIISILYSILINEEDDFISETLEKVKKSIYYHQWMS